MDKLICFVVTLNGDASFSEVKARMVALGFDRIEALIEIGALTAWGAKASAAKVATLAGVAAIEESAPPSHCERSISP